MLFVLSVIALVLVALGEREPDEHSCRLDTGFAVRVCQATAMADPFQNISKYFKR